MRVGEKKSVKQVTLPFPVKQGKMMTMCRVRAFLSFLLSHNARNTDYFHVTRNNTTTDVSYAPATDADTAVKGKMSSRKNSVKITAQSQIRFHGHH